MLWSGLCVAPGDSDDNTVVNDSLAHFPESIPGIPGNGNRRVVWLGHLI